MNSAPAAATESTGHAPTNAPSGGFSFPTFLGGVVLGVIVGGLAAAFILPMVDQGAQTSAGKVTNATARPKGAAPETGPNLRDPKDAETNDGTPAKVPEEPKSPGNGG